MTLGIGGAVLTWTLVGSLNHFDRGPGPTCQSRISTEILVGHICGNLAADSEL